jgi:hypothetical protein
LKGFIGAPGVITVFGLMVVKVTLLPALLDPDDEHAATRVTAVASASGIDANLSLRLFIRHLLW